MIELASLSLAPAAIAANTIMALFSFGATALNNKPALIANDTMTPDIAPAQTRAAPYA
jgi:hypothetical protein